MAGASYPYFNASVAETAVQVGGTGAGARKLHTYVVQNQHASNTVYLQVFDVTNPTVGGTTPRLSIPCPPGVSGGLFEDLVITTKGASNEGMSIAITAGPTNAVAPGATQVVNLTYS